jgi:hypothetical protein
MGRQRTGGYSKWNPKLSSEEVNSIVLLLLKGNRLSSISRSLRIPRSTLRDSISRIYGAKKQAVLVSPKGILAIYRDALRDIRNAQKREEAERWMLDNLDLLIDHNQQDILSDRQIRSRSHTETYSGLDTNRISTKRENGRHYYDYLAS